MTTKDEDLQNKYLAGAADGSVDGAAYKKVFHALSTEPDFNLPINFADKVIRQIEIYRARNALVGCWDISSVHWSRCWSSA
jgi:hypothetical protein